MATPLSYRDILAGAAGQTPAPSYRDVLSGRGTSMQRGAMGAMVSAAERAADVVNQGVIDRYYDRLDQIRDPELYEREVERGDRAIRRIDAARGAITGAVEQANISGTNRDIDRMDKAQDALYGDDQKPKPAAWRQLVSGAGWLLDTPQAQVRQLTTPGVDYTDERVTPERWHKALEDEKNKSIPAQLYRGARVPGDLAGLVTGAVGGAAVTGANVLADAVTGDLGTASQYADQFGRAFSDIRGDTGRLLVEVASDPLTYLSLGTGSLAKNAAKSTARGLGREGVDRAVAGGLAKRVEDIMTASGNSQAAVREVRDAFSQTLGDGGAELAEKIFGRNLEFLGRGQWRVAVPFNEKRGADILPSLGAGEFPVGKAVQRGLGRDIFQEGIKVTPGAALMRGRLGEFAEADARQARAIARELERGRVQEIVEIHEQAAKNGVDSARQRQLIEGHIDPDFEFMPKAEAEGLIPTGVLARDVEFDGVPYVAWQKEGAKYTSPANVAEQQYVDRLAKFFDEMGDTLYAKGIIPAKSENPLSGMYLPRQYQYDFDIVGEALVDRAPAGAGGGFQLKRRPTTQEVAGKTYTRHGGLAMGAANPPTYMAKPDALQAMLRYAKSTSVKEAQLALEDMVLEQYGRRVRNRSRLNRGELFVSKKVAGNGGRIREVTYAVPAPIGNVLKGTFESSMKGLRSMVAPQMRATREGRAILGVMDWAATRLSSWKVAVLVTRPAFFVLNLVDDSARMVAAGMNNPLGYLKRAERLVRRKGLSESDQALLALARENNIAIDAAHAAGGPSARVGALDIDPSLSRGKLVKNLRRMADGKKASLPVRAWEGATQLGIKAAGTWESISKLAMFLHGIDSGLAPRAAAKRSFDTLLDYETGGKLMAVARNVFPFASFMFKSPKAVIRQAVNRPGRVGAIMRSPRLFGEETLEAPDLLQEQGQAIRLNPAARSAFGAARRTVGALTPNRVTGAQPGVELDVAPRLSFASAPAPFLAAAGGNFKPLMQATNPLLNAALEQVLGGPGEAYDLQRRVPMSGAELMRPFPAGTPGLPELGEAIGAGPDFLQAPDQGAWLTRYALPLIPPFSAPPVVGAMNLAAQHYYGEQAPASVVGRPKPTARSPGNLWASQTLGMMMPYRPFESFPSDVLYQASSDPRVEAAMRALRAQRAMDQAMGVGY